MEGMQKVAKKYEENGTVGIAEVITGIDLYVCPRSDTIITILAKYGGETFTENKDSLIGCVVWRKNQINLVNSFHQKSLGSSRKKDPILVWSPIRTPLESSRKNDYSPVWSPIRMSFESSTKKDSSPVWSPIRTPFESSTKNEPVLDITKQNLRLFGYYSDIVKSEDTPNISQSVCAEAETSNLNTTNLKYVRPVLVPDVTTTVTKQSLPSVILQKEPEFETSTICSETLLEQEMVQDMDISPPESPQKNQYDNISNSTTLFAAAPQPQRNPFNACWYPPAPVSTYGGPMFHSMQTNFTQPSIHPPFPTHKPDFTYLGPTLRREHAHEYPHSHNFMRPHGQF
ncbi:hypothetical protein MtrunA17_Chr6g0461891 [Medicago truncatula]|nr:hypothetical protein MtrunA17_Chr6g0461891 [Medicago truncatula]